MALPFLALSALRVMRVSKGGRRPLSGSNGGSANFPLITISHNFPEIQRQMDQLQKDMADTVATRAINATIAQAKTAMSKEIRQEFNISRADVNAKLFIKRARFTGGRLDLVAELSSSDKLGEPRVINLIRFKAKKNKKGISVKIKKKGARKTVTGAFKGNKERTVFRRVPGSIMRTRAQSAGATHRERIESVGTINVPGMFNMRRINAAVVAAMKFRFPAIFKRELAWALQKLR